MSVILWAVMATAVALVGIGYAIRKIMPPPPPLPPDVEFPATALQRAAMWSLGVGVLLAAGAAALVFLRGPQATLENDALRLSFTFLVLGVVATVGIAVMWLYRRARRETGLLDERDRLILDRAPAIQGVGTILTVVAWQIGLTEYFREAGSVSTDYLFFVVWSCLVVYSLGLPLGVLIGYRRR
jgi:hypothetical protein